MRNRYDTTSDFGPEARGDRRQGTSAEARYISAGCNRGSHTFGGFRPQPELNRVGSRCIHAASGADGSLAWLTDDVIDDRREDFQVVGRPLGFVDRREPDIGAPTDDGVQQNCNRYAPELLNHSPSALDTGRRKPATRWHHRR
jgi:hypothetical protein